jgi:hypothetical protein
VEEEIWGDKLQPIKNKNNKTVHFIFWNCGGFLVHANQPKNHLIRSVLSTTRADVGAFAKINISWKNLHPRDRLQERIWGWFTSLHSTCSYARAFPTQSPAIAGGTALIATNEVVHRVMESMSNPMEHWCSTKFRGKGNHAIRFISAYRCVKNIHGPLSVWSQQHYLLDLENYQRDPIKKFDEDLICFL